MEVLGGRHTEPSQIGAKGKTKTYIKSVALVNITKTYIKECCHQLSCQSGAL